jgi:hypothetical protein
MDGPSLVFPIRRMMRRWGGLNVTTIDPGKVDTTTGYVEGTNMATTAARFMI